MAEEVRQRHMYTSLNTIFPLTQKTSSKPRSLVLNSYCDLDSENTLSQCIIIGAHEGTRFRVGVRQLSVKLPTTMAEGKASSWFYRE